MLNSRTSTWYKRTPSKTKTIINDQVRINYEELRRNYKEVALSKLQSNKEPQYIISTRLHKLKSIENNLYNTSLELIYDKHKNKLSLRNYQKESQNLISKEKGLNVIHNATKDTSLTISYDTSQKEKDMIPSVKSVQILSVCNGKIQNQGLNLPFEDIQNINGFIYGNNSFSNNKAKILNSNGILNVNKKACGESNNGIDFKRTYSLSNIENYNNQIIYQGTTKTLTAKTTAIYNKPNKFEMNSTIRRKSCSCNNCGGISNLELKTMHIVAPNNLDMKRYEEKERRYHYQDSYEYLANRSMSRQKEDYKRLATDKIRNGNSDSRRGDRNRSDQAKSNRSSFLMSPKKTENLGQDLSPSSLLSNLIRKDTKISSFANSNSAYGTRMSSIDNLKKVDRINSITTLNTNLVDKQQKQPHQIFSPFSNEGSIPNRESLVIVKETSTLFNPRQELHNSPKIHKNTPNLDSINNSKRELINFIRQTTPKNDQKINKLDDLNPTICNTSNNNIISEIKPIINDSNNNTEHDYSLNLLKEPISSNNNKTVTSPFRIKHSVIKPNKPRYYTPRLPHLEKVFAKISLPALNLNEDSLTGNAKSSKLKGIDEDNHRLKVISLDQPISAKHKAFKDIEEYIKSPSRRLIYLEHKSTTNLEKNKRLIILNTEPDKHIPISKQTKSISNTKKSQLIHLTHKNKKIVDIYGNSKFNTSNNDFNSHMASFFIQKNKNNSKNNIFGFVSPVKNPNKKYSSSVANGFLSP